MIWQGFHVDEAGRMVFEGAFPHVPGGGKGAFNFRFAQTTHHPTDLEGNYMPADHAPFNFLPDDHPLSGDPTQDVLATAKKMGKVPFIYIINHELEYWGRSASLIHTDQKGIEDRPFHKKVRYYVPVSLPHNNTRSLSPGVAQHMLNPLNVEPVLRAALVSFDQWISEGVEPPASRYPTIAAGTLILAVEHKAGFPRIPGMRHPGRNLNPPIIDYGPDFWTKGIMSEIPPKTIGCYITRVPAYDIDGNSIGGIRMPELQAPLGTYQGWNVRQVKYNASNYLGRFAGSFWPFELTKDKRMDTGDPRPSLAERYPKFDDYLAALSKAVDKLVSERLFIQEDADRYITFAKSLVWPAMISDSPRPFWVTEGQ
jgi:hypothetical protein